MIRLRKPFFHGSLKCLLGFNFLSDFVYAIPDVSRSIREGAVAGGCLVYGLAYSILLYPTLLWELKLDTSKLSVW